jgi:hypothetical protein
MARKLGPANEPAIGVSQIALQQSCKSYPLNVLLLSLYVGGKAHSNAGRS